MNRVPERPVRLEVHAREPFAGGHHFLGTGAYEVLTATAHYAVDPEAALNRAIPDPRPRTARRHRRGALQRGCRDPASGRGRAQAAVLRLGQPGQQAGRPVLLRRPAHQPATHAHRRRQRLSDAPWLHRRLRCLAGRSTAGRRTPAARPARGEEGHGARARPDDGRVHRGGAHRLATAVPLVEHQVLSGQRAGRAHRSPHPAPLCAQGAN